MARIARVVVPGCPHHITQRGVRSMDIFYSDKDREEYLKLLREHGARHGVKYLAYCLMSNHVHIVAVPVKKQSLASAIGEAHRLYTRMINFRQDVRGHLFQERFFSCPLDESHFISAVRYVERNPVRAGIKKKAWEYKWSSARFHCKIIKKDKLVQEYELIERGRQWRKYLKSSPEEKELIQKSTRTGRPCGDRKFMKRCEKKTKRKLIPKKRGRKSRDEK